MKKGLFSLCLAIVLSLVTLPVAAIQEADVPIPGPDAATKWVGWDFMYTGEPQATSAFSNAWTNAEWTGLLFSEAEIDGVKCVAVVPTGDTAQPLWDFNYYQWDNNKYYPSLVCADYPVIAFKYMYNESGAEASNTVGYFWCSEDSEELSTTANTGNKTYLRTEDDFVPGQWYIDVIDLTDVDLGDYTWSDATMRQFRLYPFGQRGDFDGSEICYVEWAGFFKSAEEAMAYDPQAASAASVYPASGTEGNVILGTVIGNETGWGDNAAAGAAAAFDGDIATFFDPLGVGDGFCGIDAGEAYILDKVVIMSRADWNARFNGAMIQGSNDGENWTTLWTSDGEGTNPDWYTVTEFENNTGYSQFRYFNTTEHGDVAEVEFYGNPGKVEVPSRGLADVTAAADGKNIITGYEFVSGTDSFGGEGPENLWDGETSTKFCTNVFPAESVVKLDGTYNITGFTMATANDNADYNGRSPNAWMISVSADGENWTELAKGDDAFFEETNFTYYVGEGAADGISYVKFNAEGTASGTFQVSELTVFGDKAAEPVDEKLDQKAEAPNTFDVGIIAAVTAVISLGGFAVSKKKH